ncbi:MAG TPA: DUF6502 family protein [Terriglobales bacterium]|nr:DUF6502 family protein [Terriglobales bacterium]
MKSASSTQVLAAARQWLRPLVHVLIRSGVTWKDFAELARTSYVDVATQQFGKRGRPTNVSRTAVLTGLTRREVRKQRTRLAESPETWAGHVTKGSLVLSAWHQDREFLDASGQPAPLPMEGETVSFTALLRRCGAGDVRPSTLLKELLAAQAVRQLPDGRLEPLKRSYIPQTMDEQLVLLWGKRMTDLGKTYAHNLTCAPNTAPRLERAAVSDRIAASALPEFRQFLEREGQAFLERVDAWLTEHQARNEGPDTARAAIRLGAGLYHIGD